MIKQANPLFPLLAPIVLAAILSFIIVANAPLNGRIAEAAAGAFVFVTQAKVPEPLKGSLIAFGKKNKTRQLTETKEADLAQRMWLARLIIGFSKPPQDPEITLLFYDVTGGGKKYITSMSRFLSGAQTQKEFLQSIKLPRSEFPPNRQIELVVVVRHQEVGKTAFLLVGDVPKRSNKVDFSVEETR